MNTEAATIRSLFIDGPAGRLEGLLNGGSADATHAAVVCHPHPMFGGTLHNKVVFHTMKALNHFGFPVHDSLLHPQFGQATPKSLTRRRDGQDPLPKPEP